MLIDEKQLFNDCMEFIYNHWRYGEVVHRNEDAVNFFYDIKVRYLLYSKLKEKNTHTLLDELWEWISLDEINIRNANTKEPIDWDKAVSKLERELELRFIEESYMGA